MGSTFSILFYPKRKSHDKGDLVSFYLRITVDGKRSELSLKRKIDITKWNTKKGRLNGNSETSLQLNKFIGDVRSQIYHIYDILLKNSEGISASIIKDIYLGDTEKEMMLIELFTNHNSDMEGLIGKDYSKGTLQRYKAAKSHLETYLKVVLKKSDISLKLIDHKFITGFEYFLRFHKNCSHNTAVKYVINFKKIIRIAYANGWIEKDPFFHWKASWKNKERQYLTEVELEQLITKEFSIKRLAQVRDIFVFCCFTGLSYSDVKKLNKIDIIKGIDGELWIRTKRTKTETMSSIPLLPMAKEIIDKYKNDPYVVSGKGILPVRTNQKSNAYLKEIADLCGIDKNLTTHLARHTFATTVTLSNGVPIETVSRMLGHRSLKTTQHYAKVVDKRIQQDMRLLKKKINKKSYLKKVI